MVAGLCRHGLDDEQFDVLVHQATLRAKGDGPDQILHDLGGLDGQQQARGHALVVRERLRKLGLEPDAPAFTATDLPPELDARARTLWQGEALNQAYRQTRQKLQTWLAHADELEPEVAARESYLLGNEAIRQLVFDPLLPEPLVDAAERRAFTATVLAFDEAGHRIWRERLPAALASRVLPPAGTGKPTADKTTKNRRPSTTH